MKFIIFKSDDYLTLDDFEIALNDWLSEMSKIILKDINQFSTEKDRLIITIFYTE